MVGPSDSTGGGNLREEKLDFLPARGGLNVDVGVAIAVNVRHDDAVLDDRMALPHGLGLPLLPEPEPGPVLRWYSLCRTAGSMGPERAGRPADRREDVIWFRLDRSSSS
jgi:hypothetical protein